MLSRSSEFLRFMRPTESGTKCSLAVSKSLRFIARTMLSLSSCDPAPIELDDPDGPHCFGGGALLAVRRCVANNGFRFRVAVFPEPDSVPSTLVVRS